MEAASNCITLCQSAVPFVCGQLKARERHDQSCRLFPGLSLSSNILRKEQHMKEPERYQKQHSPSFKMFLLLSCHLAVL